MISQDEMNGTRVANGYHRKPWGLILGVTLVSLVIVANFMFLSIRQREITNLVAYNHQETAITSNATYHNCIVMRAMVRWSEQLGGLEKRYHWPKNDQKYHRQRARSFSELNQTLFRVNGVPCSNPLFGQHTKKSDNKRK